MSYFFTRCNWQNGRLAASKFKRLIVFSSGGGGGIVGAGDAINLTTPGFCRPGLSP
jgi:hypothetical protein